MTKPKSDKAKTKTEEKHGELFPTVVHVLKPVGPIANNALDVKTHPVRGLRLESLGVYVDHVQGQFFVPMGNIDWIRLESKDG